MHVDLGNEIEDHGTKIAQHGILLGTKFCQLPSSALEQRASWVDTCGGPAIRGRAHVLQCIHA